MKRVTYVFRGMSQIHDADIVKNQSRLQSEIERILKAWGTGYDTEYASLSLPSDTVLHRSILEHARACRDLNPVALVVIGIGGSNLGAYAIYEALASVGHVSDLPVYWADTVDANAMYVLCQKLEKILAAGKSIIVTIISKSGATTETVANAQIILSLMQRYKQDDMHRYITVITDEGSKLHYVAMEYRFRVIFIPRQVGGRFSVFSAAGLFPLAMLGVDIEQLCAGAESVKAQCTQADILHNPAAVYAIILYELYQQGVRVHDLFIFDDGLRGLGLWYRQLMGESIGKATDRKGKRVNVGIIPTISVGSTDLHSLGQLYLSGPAISCATFISVKKRTEMRIPTIDGFANLVPYVSGRSLASVMDAIERGTRRAYEKEKRPCMAIEIPDLSSFYCGQLMQCAMVQMMYLGFLFDINPFDQPQVELYKKETREILAHE